MENYCIKKEMDKSYYKNCQKDDEYTEFLCWILEQKNWGYDLAIIKKEDWDIFYNSKEEIDMKMDIIEAENFYKQFKEVSNIDLFDETCFISMTYIWDNDNDVNLIVNDNNGVNKRYVISVIG